MKKAIFITLFSCAILGCSKKNSSEEEEKVTVSFSQSTGSDTEANGGNLPVLIINGVVKSTTTVTVSDAGTGSANDDGVDYNFTSPQVINIPKDAYDGTLSTALAIPTFNIVDDDVKEGIETIDLVLGSPTGNAALGNQTTTTYAIYDDESINIDFSQAESSGKEATFENLPVLLINGVVVDPIIVTVSDTGSGTATQGVDYTFPSSVDIIIPTNTYDGTEATAIAIPVIILDDAIIEGPETINFEISISDGDGTLGLRNTTTYTINDTTPCVEGMAGIYPCNDYDLLMRASLNELSASAANDIWGWTDSTTGIEYALVGLDNGTAFIDISDDETPVYLGKLPTATASSSWRDIKVYQDHAFIVSEASGHGMQVFDLTKLRNVTNAPVTFEMDAHFTGFGNAHNIVINEETGFAYVVGTARNDAYGGGVHFVNIQNPKNPVAAGGYGGSGYTHDAQVVTYNGPDSDYTGDEIFLGANEDTVVMVNVTDKDNPTLISTIQYSNTSYTHQGWFTEDHHYFILGDELDEVSFGFNSRTLVFDLSDLDNPILHTEYTGATAAIDHNGYVKEDDYFLANYTAGFRVLDISGIGSKSISEKAFFDTYPSSNTASFNGVWSIYPYFESGKIIVNDIGSGLFVVKKAL